MITWLIWTIWTLLSTVPRKAVEFNHSLTHSGHCPKNTSKADVSAYRHYYLRACLISPHIKTEGSVFDILRPRQICRRFTDDIFKCIFLNENVWMSLKISPKFVPKVQINNIPALVQIMARCRPHTKPLSEPMKIKLLMYGCINQPEWVKWH